MDDLTNKICVAFEEENRYDDSYFYATFFNPEKNGIERFSRIMVGSTAFAGGIYNLPTTNSLEIRQEYEDWLTLNRAYERRFRVEIGKKVIVPNARKHKGIGVVVDIQQSRYDTRSLVATVNFGDYTAYIDAYRLSVFQEFIPEYI